MLRRRRFSTAGLTFPLALVLTATGCIDRPVHQVRSQSQSDLLLEVTNDAVTKLDLLLEVDNSNSMRENQTHIMAQLGALIGTLTSPPCVSDTNLTPHACIAGDASEHLQYPPVRDMHVAVIDSDLGTGGVATGFCAAPAAGDDGAMNPIRNGAAIAQHEPAARAPAGFRPASCPADVNAFPTFLAFDSATSDAAAFADEFRCNAGLYVNGCALEQQLESVYRALIEHDPHVSPGNTDINAGFLRDDALLAIVLLTDEEDGSVRDCNHAHGEPCQDATDVYRVASTAWGDPTDLNFRMYNYQPGSAQDPTWPLDRYIDPHDASRGWLALKPGHPERIVFAAITGVPLAIPTHTVNGQTGTDWDRLLGTPSNGDPNDFAARDTSTAIDETSTEGPISMRQANIDPTCPRGVHRTVPACRGEGTTYVPDVCDTSVQYSAWPSRRIVEIARRFDQAPLCNGQPCHNGVVTSICAQDYSSAMQTIVSKIVDRITAPCLPRPLQTHFTPDGSREVECRLREIEPSGVASCDASAGRVVPQDAAANVTVNGESHVVCDIEQVPVDPTSAAPETGLAGWFYDTSAAAGTTASCEQRITFTHGAEPVPGSVTRLECVQSIQNGSATGR